MPFIESKYIDQLRDSGLHVSYPIPAFSDGVWVCKPTTTPGNRIPGYEGGYLTIGDVAGCPDIDAPMVAFFVQNDCWIVRGQDCTGGMGPADFVNEWPTPEEAITDILDFYFGNPARMARKAEERAKVRQTNLPTG